MKIKVSSIENKVTKDINLDKRIFGQEIKPEVIHRMIKYQLAKKQSGNHKTKSISEISGTTKKPFKQKGTGSARQGSRRSPHMRGGSAMFGPKVRSHAHKLPKKIRNLALKMALSQKLKEGKLIIFTNLGIKSNKTSLLKNKFEKLKIESALFIGGDKVDSNFVFASRNIPNIDVLPSCGINVYSIVRRDQLVLTEEAVSFINKRFEEKWVFLKKENLRL